MLRNTVAVLLTIILLSAEIAKGTGDPKNIAGYGKTTWGMTPNEVVNAEAPRAEKLENPEKFETGLGMVKINAIQIGIKKFNATFLFDETRQKLYQVNLKCVEEKNASENAATFSTLKKLLTEKYGPPSYKEDTQVVFWELPKTTINLRHAHIPGLITRVIVIYKPTTSIENAAKYL
ncbi:hypothetical protein [Prosthecochloris sp.]|uniref:hypothetical protein n=1 Tax=Prosthecochloris sp. TaxID=290513 RepID=UPI00258100E9|nr:hypothetical protein [Prosthecochloris sp.]